MKIGTHNGIFHADDAFAVAALSLIHSDMEIIRTRDPELLASCDLRVDVGGQYNHAALTYDHHQRDGAGARENGLPYAGFGLVWKHYGLDVVETVIGTANPIVAQRVEEALVQKIDAGDCGVKLHDGDAKFHDGDKPVLPYTLGHVVSSMNPSWHEDQDFDRAFVNAVFFAESLLKREIHRAHGSVLAETKVRSAISSSVMAGQVVVLEEYCPWQDVIVPESEALFVVYPNVEGDWMVQAIPPELGSFEMRKGLPEAWRGLRGEELRALIDVPTAIFTHPAGFIGGAETREDAITMARLAISA